KRSACMRRKTKTESRTPIRGKGWKRSSSIATDKDETISKVTLSSLTTTPVRFSELVKLVRARVKCFDGSIPWYTMSCLRELESQGRITKHRKPVLYSKKGAAEKPGGRQFLRVVGATRIELPMHDG